VERAGVDVVFIHMACCCGQSGQVRVSLRDVYVVVPQELSSHVQLCCGGLPFLDAREEVFGEVELELVEEVFERFLTHFTSLP
jgi:hypothetical protein